MSFRSILSVLVLLCCTSGPASVSAQTKTTYTTYQRIVDAPYTPFVIQVPVPGDYPRGVGAFYSKYGNYLKKKEEAALLKEEVRQKKLETRQKELQHWEWERTWTAGLLNRLQEEDRQQALIRAMNHAPLTEITSG